MDTVNDFEFKQRKYIPIFPKASGKPTVYIEGYPCEDDEPMAATDFHAEQREQHPSLLLNFSLIQQPIKIGVNYPSLKTWKTCAKRIPSVHSTS